MTRLVPRVVKTISRVGNSLANRFLQEQTIENLAGRVVGNMEPQRQIIGGEMWSHDNSIAQFIDLFDGRPLMDRGVEQLPGGEIGVSMCSGLRNIERSFGRWRSVFFSAARSSLWRPCWTTA